MSTISTILSTLRSAVWASDVRDEIANAIEQCYKDVNSPSLVTDGIEEVIGDMVDNGRISGAIVEDLGLITEGTSNLFDFTTVTAGRLNTSTGEVGEASGYWTSDFITVENGKTYYFANTDRRVAYNSSKAYSANISGTTWTASANGYVRVSVTSANRKTAKINEGAAKDYRPGRSPIDFNLRDDVYRKAEVDAALAAVTIATDPELETAGAAADAKATGDAISALNESLGNVAKDRTYTINKTKVMTTDSSGTQIILGLIIPHGKKAKITFSVDTNYTNGEEVAIRYANAGLFSVIHQTFSGGAFYNAPVTLDVTAQDADVCAIRIKAKAPSSTPVTLTMTAIIYDGVEVSGDNIVPLSPGANLFDGKIFPLIGLSSSGYTEKINKAWSVAYVPIKAGKTVTFNKNIEGAVVVTEMYDGTFDSSSVVTGKSISNSGESNAYVLFSIQDRYLDGLMVAEGAVEKDYVPYNPIGGYIENVVDDTYGVIGTYYPDEAEKLARIDSDQRPNRLRFVHVSDIHESPSVSTTPLYHMDELTDLSEANFMTITGDIVNSTISNDWAYTKAAILAMEKPCYICMGNHDVWMDTAETQRYTKYFNPIAEHNDVSSNISYYAVNFSTEGVKCIWLDQYELSVGDPQHLMSGTQINWLFSQLDDAITNGLHVCIFEHTPIGPISKSVDNFTDWKNESNVSGITWLPDIIDAFQTSGSVSFEHNGSTYSHTFGGNGVFIAYFNGHTHHDSVGWLTGRDSQIQVNLSRLHTSGENYDITYRGEKLGAVGNYVVIDKTQRRLSVLRLGNNNTIAGIKRDAFSIIY